MADGAQRGASGESKGSLTEKRKPTTGAPPAATANGSYRPPQASVLGSSGLGAGARAMAGATSTAASGSVIPPPAAEKSSTTGSSPGQLDILAERYAALAEDASFSADEAVDRQIEGLEAWCKAAIWRERRDLIRSWVLRTLTLIGASVAGAAGYLPGAPPALSLAAGTLAVVSLAIDSAWPQTADRVARHRAVRELRELQHTLRLRWDKVRLAHPERFAPKRIAHALALLDAAQAKREEIGSYLTDSSPGVGG